jgi:molecular chaperone Hsp31 and glyoxalase 3
MIKNILGLAPKLESDGSYSPSKLALKLATKKKPTMSMLSIKNTMVKNQKYL